MALVPHAAQQARLVIQTKGYAPYVFAAAARDIVKDAIWLDRAQAPDLVSSLGRDERLRRKMAISHGELRLAEPLLSSENGRMTPPLRTRSSWIAFREPSQGHLVPETRFHLQAPLCGS